MELTKHLFWQYEKVIDKKLCEYFINLFQEDQAEVGKVGIGKIANNYADNIRRTTNFFLPPNAPIGHMLYSYIDDANKNAEWDFKIGKKEMVQMSKYDSKNQGIYDWHTDTVPPDNIGYQRKLTCVLLLSNPNEFEGGQLRISERDTTPVLPTQGSIVVFPSYLLHKVDEVTKGIRYSVVAWAWGSAFK